MNILMLIKTRIEKRITRSVRLYAAFQRHRARLDWQWKSGFHNELWFRHGSRLRALRDKWYPLGFNTTPGGGQKK